MKIGIAKIDAGIPNNKIKIIDGKDNIIEKGREYGLPDNYDFKNKHAIFEEKKIKESGGK